MAHGVGLARVEADFRDSGDGQRMGFLKLVAGMLGVGLDDLVQRDTTRRHRNLAYLAAASLAGMAVTSGLAITAIQARDAARDQRREAEGLVAFMLGDLKDKLHVARTIGRPVVDWGAADNLDAFGAPPVKLADVVAAVAALLADMDSDVDELAAKLVPALMPAFSEALSHLPGITPEQVREATTVAIKEAFTAAGAR